MRVFKATYKDRKGKTQESAKWYVEFRDHLETVRRLPAWKPKATRTNTRGRSPRGPRRCLTPEERANREQTTFLAYVDDAGRYADFHSLRHTFLTNLAQSGVHPKVAQALARHSTITLTMDRYSHTVLGEQSEAVESLPSLAVATVEEVRAKGTNDAIPAAGKSVLASCLALSDEKHAVNPIDGELQGDDAAETGDVEKRLKTREKNGGSAWESNPPAARLTRGPAILKTVATTRCAGTSSSVSTAKAIVTRITRQSKAIQIPLLSDY